MATTENDAFCIFIDDYYAFKDYLNQCQQFKPLMKNLMTAFQKIKEGLKCSSCNKNVELNPSFKKKLQTLTNIHSNKSVLSLANPSILKQDKYFQEKNKDDEIKEKGEEITRLKERNQTLKAQIEKIEDEFAEMQRKCDSMEKKLDSEDQIFRSEKERLTAIIHSLDQQILTLRKEKEHFQKENNHLNCKLDSKNQDIEELKTQLSKLKDQVLAETKTSNKFSDKLQENDNKYQKNIKLLQNDVETKKQTIQSLKASNDNLQESKTSLNNLVVELRNKIKLAENNEVAIDKKLSLWLKGKCETKFLQFLSHDEKKFLKMKNGLQEVVDQLYFYEKRIQDQDNLIQIKTEFDDKFREESFKHEEEKRSLIKELDRMKEELNTLTQQVNDKKSKIIKQEKEIDDHVQRIQVLDDERKVFEEEKGNLNTQLKKVNEERNTLTKQLECKNSKMIEQEKDINEYVQQIKASNDKIQVFEEEKKNFLRELDRAKKELISLSKQLEDKNIKILKQKKEIDDYVQQIKASDDNRKVFDEKVRELTKNSYKLNEDLSRTEEELKLRNGEISSMQLKIDKLNNEKGKLMSQYNSISEQLQELKCKQKEKRAMVLRGALKESGISDSIISCINRMLVKQIRTRLTKNNIDLDIKTCQEQPPGLQDPMLVIGLKRGRVEHDIENSLKGVEVSKVSCCVYIHMISSKEKTNEIVPTKLSRSDFPPVTDMVYDTTDGIFDCEMNQQALEMIAKLLAAKWA